VGGGALLLLWQGWRREGGVGALEEALARG